MQQMTLRIDRKQVTFGHGPMLSGALMYVCLCNAITDRAMRACAERDCPTVSSVYRSLGAKPKCGKCAPLVLQLLRRAVEIPDTQPAAAG